MIQHAVELQCRAAWLPALWLRVSLGLGCVLSGKTAASAADHRAALCQTRQSLLKGLGCPLSRCSPPQHTSVTMLKPHFFTWNKEPSDSHLCAAAHVMQCCDITCPALCCAVLDTAKLAERAQMHLLTAIQASFTTVMPLFLRQRSGTALLTAATSADWAASPTRMWVM